VSDADRRNEALAGAVPLQLLIDAVVDYAIYMIGLDGRVLTWNTGAVRLKGYSVDEIIGQSFCKVYTPEVQFRVADQRCTGCGFGIGRQVDILVAGSAREIEAAFVSAAQKRGRCARGQPRSVAGQPSCATGHAGSASTAAPDLLIPRVRNRRPHCPSRGRRHAQPSRRGHV